MLYLRLCAVLMPLFQRLRAQNSTDLPRCLLPKDPGPCKASIPRFYYNESLAACEGFSYGGCGGNNNKFETEEECLSNCSDWQTDKPDSVPVTSHGPPEVAPCSQPMEPGPCRAYLTRYYYNLSTALCDKFIYGGCSGNTNRFHTKQECTNVCGGHPGLESDHPLPDQTQTKQTWTKDQRLASLRLKEPQSVAEAGEQQSGAPHATGQVALLVTGTMVTQLRNLYTRWR